jgi:adenine-specific DNA-methyltransferase
MFLRSMQKIFLIQRSLLKNKMNLGQVYTKDIVADFMVGLLDLPKESAIVDPCFGQGVFIRSLQKTNYSNLVGIEIDHDTFCKINTNDFPGCNLQNMDFFQFEPKDEIDGFILNPPYVRQEEIDDMDTLGVSKDAILKKCGDFQIYSKANLYLYFIARCVSLLRNGGQMVAIFPNAWLNTPDGKGFYSQLQQKGVVNNLIQVLGYPFVGNPLVDVMIIKFTKGMYGNTKEETLLVNNDTLTLENGFKQLKFESLDCVPLSSIAKVRRGVTTGFNKVFINPPLLADDVRVDILSSPKDVQGFSTKGARFDKLLSISSDSQLSPDTEAYIKEAESLILQEEFPKTLVNLIKGGKKWYAISLPAISDILFPYIIRDSVRFIRNDAKVIARDNFYTISSDYDPYLILGMLNSIFVFSQLELCGKSYGNGLLKIQKYDVDNIVVPNPSNISKEDQNELVKCAKSLIKTNDTKYVIETTKILSRYYHIDNIEDIYKSQKNNRLKYEL